MHALTKIDHRVVVPCSTREAKSFVSFIFTFAFSDWRDRAIRQHYYRTYTCICMYLPV